jgi:predicted ATPase
MLRVLAVEGYRSLRRLIAPLGDLTVVTGPNGSGKSSMYRALRLLAETSRNGAVGALAREGGLPSTLWAGPERLGNDMRKGHHPVQGTVRKGPVALRLGFGGDEFSYSIELGLPSDSAFALDPDIKVEAIWAGPHLRPSASLSERHGPVVRVRDDAGDWQVLEQRLAPYDSMLSEIADPRAAPEVLRVREQVRSWRFYDHFATDASAPARFPRPVTRTMVLANDGADLAAALATIAALGDAATLHATIDHAFPGSEIVLGTTAVLEHNQVVAERPTWIEVNLRQPGMLRPLAASELSEGTLRYLLLVAALLTPRPPELLVLNEPETHLHPDLLPPLADLITSVAARTQVVVVSHAAALVDALTTSALAGDGKVQSMSLIKTMGATHIEGAGILDEPRWDWPQR